MSGQFLSWYFHTQNDRIGDTERTSKGDCGNCQSSGNCQTHGKKCIESTKGKPIHEKLSNC